MLNPTSPRFPSSLKLRRTGLWTRKLLIFSLSCVCFANLFCMERLISRYLPMTSKWNSKPLDAQHNKIDSEKNGILSLPKEIILEIIKFALIEANDEEDLAKAAYLSCVNKLFNSLLKQESGVTKLVWICGLNRLEQIKRQYYNEVEVLTKYGLRKLANDYSAISYSLKSSANEISKSNLIQKISNFKIYKNSNAKDVLEDNNYALLKAAEKGNSDLLILALNRGANKEVTGNYGEYIYTPLLYAIRYGHQNLVGLLLQRGANIGVTAMGLARKHNQKEIFSLLLQYGAKVSEESFDYAIRSGDKQLIKRCIELGAKVNSTESYHRPLMTATWGRNKEIVALLLENGAAINTKNICKRTALMAAAEKGCKEIVEFLIEKGADVNIRDYGNWTALRHATYERHKEVVALLIEKGANIEDTQEKNDGSWTILMDAARWGYKEIVELLLEKGAQVTREDIKKINNTTWFKTEMVKFLESYLQQKENSSQNSTAINRRASKTCSCTIS